jgi:two-component system response regulator MprA
MPIAPADSRTILLVDHDVRTAQRLAEMLREDGFEVEFARDGAAAIARFTRAPTPAVLVTELGIPRADAAAVGRFARTQRPGLPILVLTIAPNSVDVEAFGSPAPLLFTKPIEYGSLRDALAASLSHDREVDPLGSVLAPT